MTEVAIPTVGLMSVGRFAQVSRLSKTLRLYDALGLLPPVSTRATAGSASGDDGLAGAPGPFVRGHGSENTVNGSC
jgi:hypothetical protein